MGAGVSAPGGGQGGRLVAVLAAVRRQVVAQVEPPVVQDVGQRGASGRRHRQHVADQARSSCTAHTQFIYLFIYLFIEGLL